MNSNGYCIIDKNFNVKSYNDPLLHMLALNKHESPENRLQKFIKENEILSNLIEAARNTESGETEGILQIDDPQAGSRKYDIHVLHSSNFHNQPFILVSFFENNDENLLNIHLDRSLKFNVMNKLAASIAHDIRNPLSSLAIHTEILDNTLYNVSMNQEKRERVKKSIRILNSELERVTRLIDHFFRLARTNNRETTYEDVNAILIDVHDLIKQHCYEHGIKLEMDTEKNIPFVHVNRDRLIEVILNLVINSTESMEKNGTLILRSRREKNLVFIEINDSGKGIPPDIKTSIFRRFLSTKSNGGGASLALSQKIMEAMGGKISFSSESGKGTTFAIEIQKASKF